MFQDSLPASRLVCSMVELPAPCGRHAVFYPASLADAAIRGVRYHAFHTQCPCGTAYVVTTQPDGARFRAFGGADEVSRLYEVIPWPEKRLADENGIFFCKEAPSAEALMVYFAAEE